MVLWKKKRRQHEIVVLSPKEKKTKQACKFQPKEPFEMEVSLDYSLPCPRFGAGSSELRTISPELNLRVKLSEDV